LGGKKNKTQVQTGNKGKGGSRDDPLLRLSNFNFVIDCLSGAARKILKSQLPTSQPLLLKKYHQQYPLYSVAHGVVLSLLKSALLLPTKAGPITVTTTDINSWG
jgi:hypothetical protein